MTTRAAPKLDYIAEPLRKLAVPIESLVSLEDNPRRGNVERLAALLKQFGQRMPLTACRKDDGTVEITVGNHRWLAAQQLGWTHVAVLVCDDAEDEALAWALAENTVHSDGSYDADLLAVFAAKITSPVLLALAGVDADGMLAAANVTIEPNGQKPDPPPPPPAAGDVPSVGAYVWVSVGRFRVRVRRKPGYEVWQAQQLEAHGGDEIAVAIAAAERAGFSRDDLIL